MSLVHEALEKAAREKARRSGLTAQTASVQQPPAAQAGLRPLAEPHSPGTAAATGASQAPSHTNQTLALLLVSVTSVAVMGVVALLLLSRGLAVRQPVASPEKSLTDSAAARATATAPAAATLPAEPLQPVAEQAPGFRLTGIMKDPDGRFAAVLNGRVVYEGHYVDGAIVQKIERDRLTIEMNGRQVVLRLF